MSGHSCTNSTANNYFNNYNLKACVHVVNKVENIRCIVFIAIRDVGDIVKEMYRNSPPSIVIIGHR